MRYTTLTTQVSGTGVTGRFETRAMTLPPGVERLVLTYRVETRDAKITLVRGDFDLTDPPTAAFVAALQGQPAGPRALPATGDGSCAENEDDCE